MANRYTASYADHRVITPMDKFDKFGMPGKYHSAVAINNTTGSFTGYSPVDVLAANSYEHGYGAILIGKGANIETTQIHVAGGAVITGDDLQQFTIYDISPTKVHTIAGPVYVFKRQQ
jgi:hypothetical protein